KTYSRTGSQPVPANSFGQFGPPQPRRWRICCHRTVSSRETSRPSSTARRVSAGTLASRKARTSSRKASSSPVKLRSMDDALLARLSFAVRNFVPCRRFDVTRGKATSQPCPTGSSSRRWDAVSMSCVASVLATNDGVHMQVVDTYWHSSAFVIDIGSRVPVATTSLGRAYVCALPEDERKLMLARIRERRRTEWPIAKKQFEEAFQDYEQYGY